MPSVNQEFYEEATVIVWRNITKYGFIPTGHFGHAAVMLRGPALGLGHGQYRYISWWPGEGAGKKDALRQQSGIASDDYDADMVSELSPRAQLGLQRGQHQPRRGQVETDYEDDEGTLWGAEADSLISVPGLNVTDGELGLSLTAMWAWYQGYVDNGGTYQLASRKKSCSGVAAVALIEGGGEAFASAPSAKIYMEPKQVEQYGRDLRKALADFNRRFLSFDLGVGTYIKKELQAQHHPTGVTGIGSALDLWDVNTWMQQSAVKGAMRSSVIRNIDSALKDYHKYRWGQDFRKKYQAFIKVLDNVMTHREKKPDSERGFAVARLGKQACDVFRSRAIG